MAIDDKAFLLRKEAEKKLKKFSEEENLHSMSLEQIVRLVHDLRVHQIELEIQNEHLRQLETKLELSAKRYFELYELAPVGYCTLDELGIIKESNLSASTSLGGERKKFINQSITNFIFKQDQDIFYFFKKMLFETEKSENCELRMVKNNGDQSWMRLEGLAITSTSENKKEIRLVLTDITQQVELRKTNLEQKDELRDIYQALDVSSIVDLADKEGNITYANDKFCTTSKYSHSELIGKNFRILKSGYHDKQFYKELWDTITKGKIWTGEIKNKAKDGTFYWVFTTIVPSLDAHGIPFQYVTIRSEITKAKEFEEELFKNKFDSKVAERMIEEKSKFMDIAAHELRTPITSLSLMLQIAERKFQKGQTVSADILAKLRRPTDRLARLVTDLLDISRQERGLMVLVTKETDICLLIAELLEEFKVQAPTRNILYKKADQVLLMNLDPLRISQVLSNFIDNSIKYAKEGDIEITLEDRGDFARISVIDHGPGIPKAQVGELFSAFSRGVNDDVKRASGLGLGLSICKGIIDLHQGRIGILSTEGEGSTFYFEIPKVSGKN